MPVAPTYPGVYIEEVSSGVRTIVGVATSIGAFIDRFQRGPVNRAIQIFSYADFERDFGGLDAMSAASYAIQQFFLNGGSQAHVVRVGTAALVPATRVLNSGGNTALHATAARQVRGAVVNNPGPWGNFLRLEVNYDTARLPNPGVDPENLLTQDELFTLTISEVEEREGRTFVRQSETYANLTLRAGRRNAVDVVNEGSRLVQLDRAGLTVLPAPPAAPFRPDPTGTLGGVLPVPAVVPPNGAQIDVTVDPDGAAGPRAAVTVPITLNYGGAAPAGADYAFVRPFLEAALKAGDPHDELWSGATVNLVNGRFHVLLGRGGRNFNPAATVTFANRGADTAATDLRLTGAASVGPQLVPLAGGVETDALDEAALVGSRAAKTGLYALEDADLFNILCLPAAAGLAAPNMRNVYTVAEAYCQERRAFLIVDIPETTDTLDDMQAWLTQNDTLRHRNASVYFPRPLIPDLLMQSRLRSMPGSGTIAGLYAATDVARGVWKSPAGTEAQLRGVQGLAYALTDRENGVLNPLGVNCLRTLPVFGNVAWGARTLDGADQRASDWKYLAVRRFALFLEESLYRGTTWVVFEPNDEPLWAQIRLSIGAFMQNLFRQGAFQGRTPREAYLVKCDRETTTQNDINLGIVNILVGFAPLKPAEFVIIKIQQLAGQIQT